MSYHTLHEEILSNIQPKPPVVQIEITSSLYHLSPEKRDQHSPSCSFLSGSYRQFIPSVVESSQEGKPHTNR